MRTRATLGFWGVLILLQGGGQGAAAEEARASNAVVLFDFESAAQAFENTGKLRYVGEHATQGEKAGMIVLDEPFDLNFGFWARSNMAGKWDRFDQFVIDVFVEGGAIKCFGFVCDEGNKGWWDRYNYEFKLPAGKRKVAFSLGAFVRQGGQKPLDLRKLTFFAIRFESARKGASPTIYLDNARLVKGTGAFEVRMLFSFEGRDEGKYLLEDWPPEFKGKSRASLTEEHATDGEKALRMDSRAPAGNVQFSGFEQDWSRYDTLAIDVFSAARRPVKVSGWIKPGSATAGYWDRHNYERVLKPGFNCLKLSLGGLTTPGHKPLDLGRIVAFNIAVDRETLFIDSVRLVKGVEDVAVEGLRKFDFGPPSSATMPGFTRVSKRDMYSEQRGWGWLPGGQFGRDFDIMEMLGRHRPPDDLCRDFCMPVRASFAVDVPDGEYGVWLMLGPPGNGWGRFYRHRTVKAEGTVVVDQSYTLETFKAYEFQFQDSEDLPGDDLWEKYIDVLFRPQVFETAVRDGQLTLEFDSRGAWWSGMVNGLVIYPKSQDVAGAKWLAGLDARRKEQYESLHVENLPPPPAPYEEVTDADKARGYVRFVHSPDRDVHVNSVPTPAEARKTALNLCASPGEYEDGCFGICPLEGCGMMRAVVTPLAGPGGAVIPASHVELLVVRYKALNHDAVYTITPKYLDRVSRSGIEIRPRVTRSFWVIVHVPGDAEPGRYRGKVKLSFENGKRDSVDVSLTVWPIELVEPDFPMGMFMMGPFVSYLELDATGESYWREWKAVLEDARAHGMTSVDPLVNIPIRSVAAGAARVDFSKMDRFMELARSAGFRQELCGYGVGTGFRFRNCRQSDAEARKHGLRDFGELAKAYFDAVREHVEKRRRESNDWLPICFCTDDEYIVHPGSTPEKLAGLHRVLQENAPGFRFVAFDSVYLESKPDLAAAREKMLRDIDTFGAGVHSPRLAEVVREAGRRLWLYNTGMNRFTFGTYMFFARKKHGVEGFFQWVYPMVGTYTPHYLASHREAHYGVVYPSRRGLRSTVIWERIRAGCDDHRYFETAWRLIRKAGGQGRVARTSERTRPAGRSRSLEAVVEKALSHLKFGKSRADAFAGYGRADNPMSPAGMEDLRRAVAEGIVALQGSF